MTRRFLTEHGGVSVPWILALGAAVAAVALGGFALERTGVIGSGGSPTPPAQKPFTDNVVDKRNGGELKPGKNEAAPDGSDDVSRANDEPDENEGGGGRANENEPDENDRGD